MTTMNIPDEIYFRFYQVAHENAPDQSDDWKLEKARDYIISTLRNEIKKLNALKKKVPK